MHDINYFTEYISKATPSDPPLPLTYMTNSNDLMRIVRESQLKPSRSRVFGEALLYLFYGRPIYQAGSEIEMISSHDMHYPVCILLRPECLGHVTRIYPFDSNAAFTDDYFSGDADRRSAIEHFQISLNPDNGESVSFPDIPKRIVSVFFENNYHYYYNNKIRNISKFGPYYEAESYYKLIRSKKPILSDDWKSTIEIQTNKPVPLSKDTVLAVVLPQSLLGEPAISQTLVEKWGAIPLTYETYDYGQNYFLSVIIDKIGNLLEERGYFKI
ncbi:MAG: hypothetical protein B6245_03110 [Desulfobacteraceae bacterium 4572_88]|nr:MAG: hypothetical protein B6245_03110 [Desulfobacteraceae bacterium 4572_88]